MSRGQAAFEFLLSYGYAIIGLLAVVSVLVYFAGNYGGIIPDKCEISYPFFCDEYKMQKDGSLILGIRNSGRDMSYANLSVFCNEDHSIVRSAAHPGLLINQQRLNGSYMVVKCPVFKERFKADFFLTYRRAGESSRHQALGTLSLRVE